MNLFERVSWTLKWTVRRRGRTGFAFATIALGTLSLLVFLSLKEGVHHRMVDNAVSFYSGDFQVNPPQSLKRSPAGIPAEARSDQLIATGLGSYGAVYRRVVGARADEFPCHRGNFRHGRLIGGRYLRGMGFHRNGKLMSLAEKIIARVLADGVDDGLWKDFDAEVFGFFIRSVFSRLGLDELLPHYNRHA